MSQKLDAAKTAADELFGDTSVSQGTTLDYLYELREHVDNMITAVEADIAHKEETDDGDQGER